MEEHFREKNQTTIFLSELILFAYSGFNPYWLANNLVNRRALICCSRHAPTNWWSSYLTLIWYQASGRRSGKIIVVDFYRPLVKRYVVKLPGQWWKDSLTR